MEWVLLLSVPAIIAFVGIKNNIDYRKMDKIPPEQWTERQRNLWKAKNEWRGHSPQRPWVRYQKPPPPPVGLKSALHTPPQEVHVYHHFKEEKQS